MTEFTTEPPHKKLQALKKVMTSLGFTCIVSPVKFASGVDGHCLHVSAPANNPLLPSALSEPVDLWGLTVALDGTVMDYADNMRAVIFNNGLIPEAISELATDTHV